MTSDLTARLLQIAPKVVEQARTVKDINRG